MPSALNQLFKTLSSLSDRRPRLDDARCLNQLHRQAGGCSACADACPVNAITLTPVPELDETACLGCDACAAACPSSALRGQRDPLETWRAATKSIQEAEVAFVCTAVEAHNVAATVIPCLGALPPEFYIALCLAGVDRVTVYTADCADCPLQRCLQQAEEAAASAQDFLATLGLALEYSRRTDAPPVREVEPPGMSRRGFLSSVFKPEAPEFRDYLDEFIEAGAGWRQALLLDPVSCLNVTEDVPVPALQGGWGALTVDDRCIGCEMCTQFCPSGALALTPAEEGNQISLLFCAARCTACGLCARACFKRAITLSPDVSLKALATCEHTTVWSGKRQLDPLSTMAKRGRPSTVQPARGDFTLIRRDEPKPPVRQWGRRRR